MKRVYYPQLDVLKGLAVIGVVFTHAVSLSNQYRVFGVFHVSQAVPVFITIMALNLGLSSKNASGDRSVWQHYGRRSRRVLVPFALAAVVSVGLATARWLLYSESPTLGVLNLLGYLPSGGPGNYFIPMLVALTLVGPVLYRLYRRTPVLTVTVMIGVDVGFELAAHLLPSSLGSAVAYAVNPLRVLGAFAIGLWLSDGFELLSRRNLWILLAGAVVSVSYLVSVQLGWRAPWIVEAWQPMNVLAYPYSALLVMAGMRYLPAKDLKAAWRPLASIGRASWHVFLTQMLYFGFASRIHIVPLLDDMTIPVAVGYAFFRADERLHLSTPSLVPGHSQASSTPSCAEPDTEDICK